jgi:MFS family permease
MSAKRFGRRKPSHVAGLIPVHIASLFAMAGIELLLPVLPILQTALHLTERDIVLFTMAYLLPGVLVTLPAGVLADRFGTRRVLEIALAGMGVAGIGLALSRTLPLLLAFRIIQGFCGGAIAPMTITLIGDLTSGTSQIRAQAHRSLLMTLGSAALPVIGGLAAAVHWSLPFALQGTALVLAGLILRVTPGTRPARKPRVVLRLTRPDSKVMAIHILSLLRFVVLYSFLTFLPLALARSGFSPVQVGMTLGGSAAVGAILAIFTNRMVRHVPPSSLLGVALFVTGVGLAILGFIPGTPGLILGSLVFGAGDGLQGVLQNTFLTRVGSIESRGSIVAVAATAKNLGKLFGPPLILLLSRGVGTALAFAILGVGTMLGAAAARPLRGADEAVLGS